MPAKVYFYHGYFICAECAEEFKAQIQGGPNAPLDDDMSDEQKWPQECTLEEATSQGTLTCTRCEKVLE